VTAKYLSPLATTAVAIVFTEALPSDHAVCKCRSACDLVGRDAASGSKAFVRARIDRAFAGLLLESIDTLQPIRCRRSTPSARLVE
jgi:hypothetical protein